jgi:hypothetical protein
MKSDKKTYEIWLLQENDIRNLESAGGLLVPGVATGGRTTFLTRVLLPSISRDEQASIAENHARIGCKLHIIWAAYKMT